MILSPNSTHERRFSGPLSPNLTVSRLFQDHIHQNLLEYKTFFRTVFANFYSTRHVHFDAHQVLLYETFSISLLPNHAVGNVFIINLTKFYRQQDSFRIISPNFTIQTVFVTLSTKFYLQHVFRIFYHFLRYKSFCFITITILYCTTCFMINFAKFYCTRRSHDRFSPFFTVQDDTIISFDQMELFKPFSGPFKKDILYKTSPLSLRSDLTLRNDFTVNFNKFYCCKTFLSSLSPNFTVQEASIIALRVPIRQAAFVDFVL